MKKSSKKNFRDIKEIYKELVDHPDYIVFDIWDVDDVVDRIVGDIKDVKYRELVRKRTIKNKNIIGKRISEVYDSNWYHNDLYLKIDCCGIFDDLTEGYSNYEDEF
jgi:hypothetical protein